MRKSIILRFLVLAVSAYMIYTSVGLYSDYRSKKNDLMSVEKQREQKKAQIAELKETLKDDKKIIEKAAKERLGFAYADELEYRDISDS